eukprot:c18298_g1_i5.p1 GENE.c18298_g1_i5~~c18298_g1_i5.p1  ORF type:complete len:480 (+),score=135.16 c18298_g1_i5:286-1725(+)
MLGFLLTLMVVFFGSIVYEFEHAAQPEKFRTIPETLYWGVITMTTVGYGDLFPITTAGRLVTGVAMIFGVMSIALPVTLVGAESVKAYDRLIERKRHLALKKGRKSKHRTSSQATEGIEAFVNVAVNYHLLWGGSARLKVWSLLDDPSSSKFAKALSLLMALVIVISSLNIVFASMSELDDNISSEVWRVIEVVCVAIFTVELVSRFVILPELAEDRDSFLGRSLGGVGIWINSRSKFFGSPFNLIDLLAVLPFYIDLLNPNSNGSGPWAAVRVIRLSRLARVFKLGSQSQVVDTFVTSLKNSAPAMMMLGMFVFSYLLFFGSLLYECEKDVEDTQFVSVPASFWWAISTLTTVGYGDMTPKTTAGKVISCFAAISGIVGITTPLSIIGVFFAELAGLKAEAKHNHNGTNPDIDPMAAMQNTDEDKRVRLVWMRLNEAVESIRTEFPDFEVDLARVEIVQIEERKEDPWSLEMNDTSLS